MCGFIVHLAGFYSDPTCPAEFGGNSCLQYWDISPQIRVL